MSGRNAKATRQLAVASGFTKRETRVWWRGKTRPWKRHFVRRFGSPLAVGTIRRFGR